MATIRNELVLTLARRDGLTIEEVNEWIEETVEGADGEDPEEMLHYEFGLEPDYVFDLMEFMQ